MTVQGTVVNGVIVPDNIQLLPEGTRVEIVVPAIVDPASACDQHLPSNVDESRSLSELLSQFAGCMTELPADFAAQHDHYIHGTPKR